ncbi:NERD domain-containing protein [Viridibacillus sp. YIM B01967]|uniref:NERD domain-containing protein n=1 Tax=Viridibacillus soli TaxID=2798301 RepID=A0ABS1H865_9BACL|nr:nuclease-related domain-containing protein [Viridibacillus soli]MBK3495604.1 NERD domain-containing protein [Viridibacillus soli]
MRLSPSSPKIGEIEKYLDNIQAGYNGECRVDQLIQETHFKIPFHILPNVELQASQNRFTQIDSLIITTSYICILEIKHLKGTLTFQENPYQLVQVTNGKIVKYVCPQQQILRTEDSLKFWLQKQLEIDIPIHKAIVLPNKQTYIESPPTKVKLLGPKEVALYLQELNNLPAKITKHQFDNVISKIKQSNKPYKSFPLAIKYDIPTNHLKMGIICPCGGSGRRISQRSWQCTYCKNNIENAITQAMQDWFWLFKNSITNEECRNYLQINNKSSITRILKSMNLTPIGHTSSRTYYYHYQKPLFKKSIPQSVT